MLKKLLPQSKHRIQTPTEYYSDHRDGYLHYRKSGNCASWISWHSFPYGFKKWIKRSDNSPPEPKRQNTFLSTNKTRFYILGRSHCPSFLFLMPQDQIQFISNKNLKTYRNKHISGCKNKLRQNAKLNLIPFTAE